MAVVAVDDGIGAVAGGLKTLGYFLRER